MAPSKEEVLSKEEAPSKEEVLNKAVAPSKAVEPSKVVIPPVVTLLAVAAPARLHLTRERAVVTTPEAEAIPATMMTLVTSIKAVISSFLRIFASIFNGKLC